MKGRLRGRIEPPDSCDASAQFSGSVDLVPGDAGGFVDEYRSEGRVSGESKRAAAHGVGEGKKWGWGADGLIYLCGPKVLASSKQLEATCTSNATAKAQPKGCGDSEVESSGAETYQCASIVDCPDLFWTHGMMARGENAQGVQSYSRPVHRIRRGVG